MYHGSQLKYIQVIDLISDCPLPTVYQHLWNLTNDFIRGHINIIRDMGATDMLMNTVVGERDHP